LKSKTEKTIVFNLSDGSDNINSGYFSDKIKEVNYNVSVIDINSDIPSEKISELIDQSRDYNVIIASIYAKVRYGTGKISILPSQAELLDSLDKTGKKLIVISFGNPYLMKEFPDVSNYVCAYGDADVSINSAIKVIYGDIKFKGILPVSINDDFKSGMGISK
jgi:beta-N-acetylhexosaminidase